MIVYCEEVQIVSDRDKECVKLFDLPKEICHDLECHRRVYSVKASTPTLNARSDSTKILEVEEVENVCKIKVRQATKDGFVECEVPGIVDLNYDTSTTRRGRVVEGGRISPALTTENIPSVIEIGDENLHNFLYEIDGKIYMIRIRKLIPKECWNLMDFNDGAFEKAQEVNSNTQLYKQAGNSIVVNCLVAILGQLFEGKEDVYKNI